MADYDFSTLNDKDLEALTRDLLNREYSLNLQDFKTGRDGGIDLRCAGDGPQPKVVVQVKHYLRSGVAKLKHDLLAEYIKVQPLSPERYIVATSISLSASDKDLIKAASLGLIKSPDDVFGKEDLNALLRSHGDILKSWYKLWFSNSEVLERILHSSSYSRSAHTLDRITRKLQLYVETKDFSKAMEILRAQRVLMITGVPGIGKTTVAEMILYRIMAEEYELISVANIDEAEERFSPDPQIKQLFDFDDFLGATYLEFNSAAGKASRIAAFVERVRHSHHRFMVMTTRTVILNKMRSLSDKIERLNLGDSEYEIQLGSYSDYDKARILYNHMYFSGLTQDMLEVIFRDRFYMNIIRHRNYSPRIVEYITDERRIRGLDPAQYRAQIISSLDVPEEIWRHSFETQIDEAQRAFLFTMFSIQGDVEETVLKEAYLARIAFENSRNGLHSDGNVWDSTVRVLQGGFVDVFYDVNKKKRYFRFVNPSLADFIGRTLRNNEMYLTATVCSTVFLEQLIRLNPMHIGFSLNRAAQEHVVTLISQGALKKATEIDVVDAQLVQIEVLLDYCPDVERAELLIQLFDQVPKSKDEGSMECIRGVLLSAFKCEYFREHVRKHFFLLAPWFLDRANGFEDLEMVRLAFDEMVSDYSDYLKDPGRHSHLVNVVDRVIAEEEQLYFDDHSGSVFSDEDYFQIQQKFARLGENVIDALLPGNTINWNVMGDDRNWDEIIAENQIESGHAQAAQEVYKDTRLHGEPPDERIHQLFS